MVIEIDVSNKIARLKDRHLAGVCGNSDYVIHFDFDSEWNGYETKVARFKWNGTYEEVAFAGNECPMPIIYNAYRVEIGVYAGNLHTTTAAILMMKKSVLCNGGSPAAKPDSVYTQILEHEPTNAAVLSALNDAGLVAPIANADGAVLTDGDSVYIY